MANGILLLIFAGAIGSGVIAGIFFAFSTFVMTALGRIPPEQGIAAMQSINVAVLNPLFFLAFFGTGLVCLGLVASHLWWGGTGGMLVLLGSLIYLAGSIGVTMACNVPLNDALAAAQPDTPAAAALWAGYLKDWTWWNHVRTAASLASAILLTAART
jgi:uncharacterized membrane protein